MSCGKRAIVKSVLVLAPNVEDGLGRVVSNFKIGAPILSKFELREANKDFARAWPGRLLGTVKGLLSVRLRREAMKDAERPKDARGDNDQWREYESQFED